MYVPKWYIYSTDGNTVFYEIGYEVEMTFAIPFTELEFSYVSNGGNVSGKIYRTAFE